MHTLATLSGEAGVSHGFSTHPVYHHEETRRQHDHIRAYEATWHHDMPALRTL